MTTRNKKNSLSKIYLNIDKRLVKIATTSSIGMPESGYNTIKTLINKFYIILICNLAKNLTAINKLC